MMESQGHPLGIHRTTAEPRSQLTSLLRFAVVVYVFGMLVVLVEQGTLFFSNLAPVDFWNILFIPVCWLYLIRTHQVVRFPFALGMWFILLGSLIGTFAAFNPLASMIVIAKELYLYVWFVTLAAVFAGLESGLLRRALLLWVAVVVLHGALLIAELVSPSFYAVMLSTLGKIGAVDVRYIGRPAGVFQDPVWAALFQLMGIVPLLLAGLRRTWTMLLGTVLLLSILATASLGALTSLAGASAVGMLVYLLSGGRTKFFGWLAAVLTLAVALVFFTNLLAPDVLVRLEQLTLGRAAHTLGERLHLWQGGTEVVLSPDSILGVGPDNYRDFQENKTLHNDALEFIVERGVIGLLGLALLAIEAVNSAVKILWKQIKSRDMAVPSGVIFLAMLVGLLLESNAHQIFHFRVVWVALALLEATLFRMTAESTEAPAAMPSELENQQPPAPARSSHRRRRRSPTSADAG